MVVSHVAHTARDRPGLHPVSREGLQEVGRGRRVILEKPLVIVALLEDDGHAGMNRRGQLIEFNGKNGEALEPVPGLCVIQSILEAGEGKGAALGHSEDVGLFLSWPEPLPIVEVVSGYKAAPVPERLPPGPLVAMVSALALKVEKPLRAARLLAKKETRPQRA